MTPLSQTLPFRRLATIGLALLIAAALLAAPDATPPASAAETSASADRISVFSADNGTHGRELWRTDGTTTGTRLVKDIARGGRADSNPTNLVAFRRRAYFAASSGTVDNPPDRELWRSDGTADGTRRVLDIRKGTGSSRPDGLTVRGRKLFFAATTGDKGRELWRSDGTAAGTKLLVDVRPGNGSSSPMHITRVGNKIFFTADDGEHGREVWRTDGTKDGTRRLTNFDRAPAFAYEEIPAFTAVGDLLYFLAGTERSSGFWSPDEVWRSNGTRSGTFLVKDIDRAHVDWDEFRFVDVSGAAVFRAIHKERGRELWRSRGTRESTTVISNIANAAPTDVCGTLSGIGYFGTKGAGALYRTDGTEAGTRKLFDHPAGDFDYFPTCSWDRYQGALYWDNDLPEDGYRDSLWRTDGTGDAPERIKTWRSSYAVFDREASGGLLYLSVGEWTGSDNEFENDPELWRSDGTEGGTSLVKDIWPGGYGSFPNLSDMVAIGR